MFDEISMILYCLMRFVYKEKDADHAINLRKVINKEFLLNPSKQLEEYLIDLGVTTNDTVKNLKVTPEKKRRFREGCKKVIVEILLKIPERLPTNQMVVINVSSLSPVNMAQFPSKAQKKFKKLADNFYSLKFITSFVADNAKFQYEQFMTKEVVLNQEKFLKSNFKTDRLDSFL